MKCPKCKAGKLENFTIQGDGPSAGQSLELDQCDLCGGIWFDAGELETYLKGGFKPVDAPELDPQIAVRLDQTAARCPRCDLEMAQHKSPQDPRITGDYCGKCGGLWLDAGETNGMVLAQRVAAVFDGWLDKLEAKRAPKQP